MRPRLPALLAWTLCAAAALAHPQAPAGLGFPPTDSFHPDRQAGPDGALPPLPEPTWGGTITIHTENLPRHLNLALASSAYARRILSNTHAWLERYDPRTLRREPEIATSVDVDDLLTRNDSEPRELIGRVEDAGPDWLVRSASGDQRVPKAATASVAKGTVLTFHLGAGWTWHDGHPFDADDVIFSWSIYQNPDVKCDDRRWQHQKIRSATKLDARTVRFVYAEQYFHARVTVGDMFLLPRHLYDPTDPDHERYDPEFHAARRAKDPQWKPGPKDVADCVNDNPRNRLFVGLGPYRIASWVDDVLEVERAPGWKDDQRAGHFDRIRWRRIPDYGAAFRALAAGEIDFLDAVTTDDYFGSVAASDEFRAKYYLGTHRSQSYWYVGWNTKSPKLADPRVRRALAHLADLESFRVGYYRGLARTMAGPFLPDSPACDPAIRPLAHDVARAEALLAEAGWIDRDGDGIRDRDGVALEIELLVEAKNAPGQAFAAKYQEDLARGGVRLKVQGLDFNTLDERKKKRQFEAVQQGWAMAPEADPEQAWHSRWAPPEKQAGNFVGLADPQVDAIVEAGQEELDFDARQGIWHRLQARLMELQPYLYCYAPLRKFAMLRSVRGFQETAIDPNWDARDLYFAPGTPGTRDRLR
ncbi:MAG: ABC transporter substrate-binding protein [Planctomycetota bacterium]|nr:ABC transporter substrate-binding protein [Planctomycetota bacterium]